MKDTKLLKIVKKTDDVEADAIWAILKYKNIGILRKVMCICKVLDIDTQDVLATLPKDENGRYLDKPTRKLIHDALIIRQAKK
jgi:hypothetical protein